MALADDLRTKIRTQVEAVGGRHDEPEVYGGPAGDPGLAGGPGQHLVGDQRRPRPASSAAGMAAIIMEVLHPSVMAGVYAAVDATAPSRCARARNTLGYVLRTTFGSTEAATAVIEHVKHVHGHINGTRPDGVPYRALDPELIALGPHLHPVGDHGGVPPLPPAAHRRRARPRTSREQAPIGRMGGAEWVPESMAELDDYVERMRPLMAMTEQTREFIDFLVGDSEGEFRGTRPPAARAPARHLGARCC